MNRSRTFMWIALAVALVLGGAIYFHLFGRTAGTQDSGKSPCATAAIAAAAKGSGNPVNATLAPDKKSADQGGTSNDDANNASSAATSEIDERAATPPPPTDPAQALANCLTDLDGRTKALEVTAATVKAVSASPSWLKFFLCLLTAAAIAGAALWSFWRHFRVAMARLEKLEEGSRAIGKQADQIGEIAKTVQPLPDRISNMEQTVADLPRKFVDFIAKNHAAPAAPPPIPVAPMHESFARRIEPSTDPRYEPVVPLPAPPPAPPPAPSADPFLADYRALIANPAASAQDFDALLSSFGTAYNVNRDGQGGWLLTDHVSGDVTQKLVAFVQRGAGDNLLLLPSSNFIKEFAMTFKESLEAGFEIKELFDTRIDGSGILTLIAPATARRGASGLTQDIARGVLGGFVR